MHAYHGSRLIVDEELLIPQGGEDYIIEEPILSVVEAKHARTSDSDSPSSKVELLGQFRILGTKIVLFFF